MRVIKEIRWQEAITIIKKCKLIHAKSLSLLMAYYIISILNALFDGVSMVLLVGLITGKTDLGNSTAILQQVKQGLSVLTLAPSFASIYVAIILLFLLRMFLSFSVVALEGYFNAVLRRIIQEKGFTQLVKGNWEFLRNIRVGQRLGAITEESTYVARYFTSIIKAGYGAISSLVLVIIAMSVSTEVTLLFIAVGVPAVLILKYLFSIQSKIAARLVIERQELYADITEILNGLFQVKVEGNEEYHTTKGLKNQKRLTKSEISFGYSQAAVSAFNLFLPAVLLVVFYLWSAWSGNQLRDTIYILAGVGTVGARALTQVNSTIASLGNLIGFAGSIPPIYDLVNIPVEPPKELITEKVSQIQLREVSYWYGQDTGIKSINLGVKTGSPLILLGPSGSGKTTLANLISGVYKPHAGEITYISDTGKSYNSKDYRPKVGYVTQDIHLFLGTVRENLLTATGKVSEEWLWKCLRLAGAEDFVHQLGGLDGIIAEAGRSLSGGQRRRLGIARVLTGNPDVLILDEVTVGLDKTRKDELINTINHLAEKYVVIVITHDSVDLIAGNRYSMGDEKQALMVGESCDSK